MFGEIPGVPLSAEVRALNRFCKPQGLVASEYPGGILIFDEEGDSGGSLFDDLNECWLYVASRFVARGFKVRWL